MSLSESLKSVTSGARSVSRLGEALGNQSRSVRWSFGAICVLALYLLPWWPNVPVLGWIVETPGTSFPSVLTDQVVIFVLVALGLNVVVGLAGLLDLGYVGFTLLVHTRLLFCRANMPTCRGSCACLLPYWCLCWPALFWEHQRCAYAATIWPL